MPIYGPPIQRERSYSLSDLQQPDPWAGWEYAALAVFALAVAFIGYRWGWPQFLAWRERRRLARERDGSRLAQRGLSINITWR